MTITTVGSVPSRYWPINGTSYPDPGVFVVSPSVDSFPSGKTGTEESMTDTNTAPGNFNPCYHTKVEWDCPLETIKMRGHLSPPREGDVVESEFQVGCAFEADWATNSPPFMATDEQLLAEASSACAPRVVRPRFDWALQAGEVKEGIESLYGLRDNLINLCKDIKRLNKVNSPVVRRLLGKRTFAQLSLTDWADLASQLHLGYQFMVKPTIQAIQQCKAAMEGYNRTLEQYLNENEVLHGVSMRVSEASSTFVGSPYDYNYWGNTRTYRVEVHALAEVRYCSPCTEALLRDFKRDYYNLVPDITTAYQLYPLSFVLDWFVGFGNVLRRWAERPIDDITYSVVRSGWSKKTVCESHGWSDVCAGMYRSIYRDITAPPRVEGTVTRTTYLREPKTLDLESFVPKPPDIRWPSIQKWVTIGELARQIMREHKQIVRVLK